MGILASAPAADNEVVERHSFAPGAELLTVDWPDGRHAATLVLEVDRDVTADELRALAALYEAFPASAPTSRTRGRDRAGPRDYDPLRRAPST